MNAQSVIATRRDARKHTEQELGFLAKGAADGSFKDYQVAAWLMAAYLNPLDREETAWLTRAMADSGDRMDLRGLPKPWVDKHSTGGVGDKTSIVVLPILAACGLTIIKMSGRGLGITGGTVDKLSAIPGFRIDLSPEEMKAQAAKIGIALTGQTPDLAPADKVMYALRDATSTVASAPLIVSSILSKKIAGGAETIVLDVKAGRGAFMRTLAEAEELADWLSDIAQRCGLKVRVAISDMDQPLGRMVGNALEVQEALDVLNGEQSRFSELCVHLAGETLEASGLADSQADGEASAREAILSGKAAAKAQEWFAAQGAVPGFELPKAAVTECVPASWTGWVSDVDAGVVGEAVVELGGGRHRKEDEIDVSVGVELHVEVGSQVVLGSPLYTIHATNRRGAEVAKWALARAVRVGDSPVERRPALIRTL